MAKSSYSSYDRSVPIVSDDSILSSSTHRFPTDDTNTGPSHIRHHLDDADLLTLKRQYPNGDFHRDNNMSNSVDNLTQLNDHMPYQNSTSDQDFNDPDDDEIHFNDVSSFDYDVSIQERLKRANEVFEHDKTPSELSHQQRVSFDTVVKAVDIVQDSEDGKTTNPSPKQPILPVVEEPSTNNTNSQNESNPHQYTVPLNDTRPRETPTLVEQIKAMQFYGGPVTGDRRPVSNGPSNREDNSSPSKLNENSDTNTSKSSSATTNSSPTPYQNSVLVAKNGRFEFQTEDDYTAKRMMADPKTDSDDDDDDKKSTTKTTKVSHTPSSSNEEKTRSDSLYRSQPLLTRPKSSDSGKRTDNKLNDSMSTSLSSNKNNSTTNNQPRAKSAGVSHSIQSFIFKPSSTVDFNELNRQAAERKRTESKEERRKREEAEAKREEDLARARECYAKWLQDKDAERRRLNEEKRLEMEDEKARQAKCEKELGELRENKYKEWIERKNNEAIKANEYKRLQTEGDGEDGHIKSERELGELREKKYKEWIERKNRQVMMANEFKKLQAKEEEMTSGGSLSSIQNSNSETGKQAFRRWLRQKREQSKEEKRRVLLETRRLRRHQRRSLKRYQLQQDLQLARSFGYT